MDLFATGFEYNPGSGIDLANSRKALLQYRSNLDTLHPMEEQLLDSPRPVNDKGAMAVGGVYAITIRNNSVQLFNLGSISRGIPPKRWEIPVPVGNLKGYSFYPVADVIAFFDFLRVHCQMKPSL